MLMSADNMEHRLISKGLAVAVIILFIGVGVQPAFAIDIPEKEEIEPKDYLFETIIELANNPEFKELFDEYGNNIYNLNYNYKGVFLQILFNNPKLLFSKLFTKPKITNEYLNSVFNEGQKIVDIIGEDKALEMIKSVKLTNPDIFNDLHNIVSNNKELSNRISTLEELNEESFEEIPIICGIIAFLMIRFEIRAMFFYQLYQMFIDNPELSSILIDFAYFYEYLFLICCLPFVLLGCYTPYLPIFNFQYN